MPRQQRPYRIVEASAGMFLHGPARLSGQGPGHAGLKVSQWILHDFDDDAHEEYVRAAYEIFLERLEVLKSPEGDLTVEEEAELRFMLDALIAAKQL